MISPEEIKSQALKWWQLFLQSFIAGETFFPRTIDRIGKVRSTKITSNFEVLQKEIELLYRCAKSQTGTGYLVNTASHSFRRIGNHELPDSIVFETSSSYASDTTLKSVIRSSLSLRRLIFCSRRLKSVADTCFMLM